MKKFIVFAIACISMSAQAQTDKTLIFCDAPTGIFMDLYFDYDATTGVYSNLEVGVLNEEQTNGYPEYLMNVVTAPGAANEVSVVATNVDSTFNFTLPQVTKDLSGTPVNSYVVNKTDGVVDQFELHVTGTHMGSDVDQSFFCYDPSMLNNPVFRSLRH